MLVFCRYGEVQSYSVFVRDGPPYWDWTGANRNYNASSLSVSQSSNLFIIPSLSLTYL